MKSVARVPAYANSSSGSDLFERPIPRVQAGVVASATASPQVPPREHQPTANRSPSDALDGESGALSFLLVGVLVAN
jgi:hypothetical protein